ncbi:nitroreductase family deazaflavin-dependent oxidoreductase [Nocardia tengchongensis]|uniref:Nitroreductase family deazaflavin-dependent oxidoreductase n=1 Tax=Nocardia tengchongensis TaxID=2055889 RepID=A0ABX8D0U8_9NOCA|nr:nitroreductase/quinone reductase family protein [Nocardia tengchongensis]QVI24345.1 nitroreductase family deazaflavin-dependent oxidoreductase [Nocardia tengchongensis]
MPPNLALKAMNIAHRGLLRATGGKLGNSFSGMPSLELTTIGRKSGRPHTVMLTSPLVDGDTIIVVASRGGGPAHPAWYLNLRDRPEVDVSFRSGPRQRMTARIATAAERAELWPKVTAKYDVYAAYQQGTTREIPLVLLTPAVIPGRKPRQ